MNRRLKTYFIKSVKDLNPVLSQTPGQATATKLQGPHGSLRQAAAPVWDVCKIIPDEDLPEVLQRQVSTWLG